MYLKTFIIYYTFFLTKFLKYAYYESLFLYICFIFNIFVVN